ncbi:MAG: transposase [Cyanobacteria bacterium P01_A01_bin.37]
MARAQTHSAISQRDWSVNFGQLAGDVTRVGAGLRQSTGSVSRVAPFNRDSGTFSGRRRIWGGRAAVRSLMYMATLSAIRANPPIRAYDEHLLSKGKVKKVAVVACMRKLVVHLCKGQKKITDSGQSLVV